jgi:alpha-1,4-digalacturonate transport system substrate-binding protein
MHAGKKKEEEMRKVIIFAIVISLLIPMALFAGGKQEGAQEMQVIRFVWFTDGPDKPAIEGLVADYEAANPNVKVELSIVPFGELNQLLTTQASAGQAPDVARVTEPYRFFEHALDLRPYVASNFADQFLPEPMKLVTDPSGAIIGFPHDLTMNGPLVNVSLFKKAGVPLPKGDVTWQTWFDLAKEVQQKTGVPYAATADRSGHRLDGIIQSFGGSYFTPDGKSLNLSSQRTRDALKYFVDLHKNDTMPLDIWAGGSGYVGANQQFINQQLVFYVSGNWQVAQFAENIGDKFEWKAVPNGVNVQSGGMPGGKFVMAFKGSADPGTVAHFVEFLSSNESVEKYASTAMFLPARKDLIESGIKYPMRSEDMNTFAAGLARLPGTAYSDNYHLKFGAVANIVRDRVTQAITGEVTFDEAMNLMEREAKEVMQ